MILHHDKYTLEGIQLDPNKPKINIALRSVSTKRVFVQRSSYQTDLQKKHIRDLLKLFCNSKLPNIIPNTLKIESLNRILNHNIEVELEAKTTRQPTLVESRYFVKYKKLASHSNCEIEEYNLSLVEEDYNLATFHFRGNDTCYFACYNTRTGKKGVTCDVELIINFMKSCPVPFVMDSTGYLLLNELVYHGGISGIKSKSISNMTAPNCINVISVQDLLGKRNSYDLIAKLAFPKIKAVIPYSEGDNCLQSLEALKYVFDVHLKEPLATYEKLKPLFNQYGVTCYSKLAEKLFSKASTQPITPFNIGTYEPYIAPKFDITTGKSGLGGVHGCLKRFVSNPTHQVVYLDYKSYYPSILLNYQTIFEDFINTEEYLRYYHLKQNETNSSLKEAYKTLINAFIGVLGTDKPGFNTLNREAWEFIIRTGQNLMYATLREIMNLNPEFELVHVNTDGAYFVKPRGLMVNLPTETCNKHALTLEEHTYEQIAIYDLNNYIIKVNNQGDFIAKGDYRHCYCPYVKEHVYKGLFGESLGHIDEKDIKNFVLLDKAKLSRCIKTKLGNNKSTTQLDLLQPDYIQKYNETHDNKIIIDKEEYDNLVKKLTF